jgi:DNA-binding NarL/FixJ family response regulator
VIRVLIAADVRLYREGLAATLGRAAALSIVGTAADWTQCLARTRELAPDVLLLDTAMPESLAAARSVGAASPEVRVVAFGILEEGTELIEFAQAGVAAYVTRDASLDELVASIGSAARGESVLSPRLAAALLQHVASLAVRKPGDGPERRLTTRELQILSLIDEGLSNKQIARQLSIEVATVKNHVHHILEKLEVSRRADAAAFVRDLGLVGRSREI